MLRKRILHLGNKIVFASGQKHLCFPYSHLATDTYASQFTHHENNADDQFPVLLVKNVSQQWRRRRQGRRPVTNELVLYLRISQLSRSVQHADRSKNLLEQAKYIMSKVNSKRKYEKIAVQLTDIQELKKPRRRRRGQRRLKNEFIFYRRISRHPQVTYFVYHCQSYHKTKSGHIDIRNENLKN